MTTKTRRLKRIKHRKPMTEEQMIRREAKRLKKMLRWSRKQQRERLRQLKLTASSRIPSLKEHEEHGTTGREVVQVGQGRASRRARTSRLG